MKFAVIATGGKQYKVSEGDSLKVEKMRGEYKEGDKISFDEVLCVGDEKSTTVGMPRVEKASVSATISSIARSPKVRVVKFKSKSRYHKVYGHRQPYFEVKIDKIK
jgi:large subunit ribosomal protein L21